RMMSDRAAPENPLRLNREAAFSKIRWRVDCEADMADHSSAETDRSVLEQGYPTPVPLTIPGASCRSFSAGEEPVQRIQNRSCRLFPNGAGRIRGEGPLHRE